MDRLLSSFSKVYKSINVAFVGGGRIADVHAQEYLTGEVDACLYGIYDPSRETCERRMEEWNLQKIYGSLDEILEDPNIDAVEILSPTPNHHNDSIKSIRSGKHVAIQKPMSVNLEEAYEILEEAEKVSDSQVVKVTDNYLFYEPIVRAKEMMENGEIGDPTTIRVKFISGTEGGWSIDSNSWQWRLKLVEEGGIPLQTFDHGHHLYAVLWYLFGDVERVKSWINTGDGIVDCPSLIMVKFSEGEKLGVVEYSHCDNLYVKSDYYANDEWLEICGSNGVIDINQCTGNFRYDEPVMKVYKGEDISIIDDVSGDWGDSFRESTKNFIGCIEGTCEPQLKLEDAIKIMEISIGIQESSKLGREVFIEEYSDLTNREKIFQERNEEVLRSRIISEDDDDDEIPQGGFLSKLFFWRSGGSGNLERIKEREEEAVELTLGLGDRFQAPPEDGRFSTTVSLTLRDHEKNEEYFRIIVDEDEMTILEVGREDQDVVYDFSLEVDKSTWTGILKDGKSVKSAFVRGKLKFSGNPEIGLKIVNCIGIS